MSPPMAVHLTTNLLCPERCDRLVPGVPPCETGRRFSLEWADEEQHAAGVIAHAKGQRELLEVYSPVAEDHQADPLLHRTIITRRPGAGYPDPPARSSTAASMARWKVG